MNESMSVKLLAAVSMRDYASTVEQGVEGHGISRSAVSRRAIKVTAEAKVFDELVKLSEPAAGSLMEGMEETLTVHKLRLGADLKRMLSTTNSIESMFSMARRYKRNVKRWKNYEHIERTLVTTLLEAERRFRRVRGYRELKDLKKRIQEYCATTKNTMAA